MVLLAGIRPENYILFALHDVFVTLKILFDGTVLVQNGVVKNVN